MNHHQLTKIGPAHGKPHSKVWIEGKHLLAAGFKPGDRYDRHESSNMLTIQLTPNASGRYKVAGKGSKPILDISGAIIPRLFPPPASHVHVQFLPRVIILSLQPIPIVTT
jgi:hypothetical protein